jgi:ABC-type multidrug transport system fused ATPase/permease subunit
MNRVAVTIVDFMAFLVPGVVFLFALVLVPIPDAWTAPLSDALSARVPLLSNPGVAGGCWVLSAYLLGFLLRLTSIDLISHITSHRWVNRVQEHSQKLSSAMEEAIDNQKIVEALKAIADLAADRGVSKWAPYFQFAKRVVRTRPELWVEAERLEAEIRLMAGLFVPFVVLAIAGGLRLLLHFRSALVLVAVGVIGAATVYRTFPDRRIKEALYDQLLAFVALRKTTSESKAD